MKLKKLDISHFRCFDHYVIDFAPGVNVIFGKNGAGKSSLIDAMHKSLSFIFANIDKKGQLPRLGAGNTTLHTERFYQGDGVIDPATGNAFPLITINAEADIPGMGETAWSMEASTNSYKPKPSKYMKQAKQFVENVAQTGVAPVLAFYSDSYPHVETKTKLTKKVASMRNFGYHQWNEECACSTIWIKRLEQALAEVERSERSIKKLDAEGKQSLPLYAETLHKCAKARKEVDAITSVLKKFTQNDPDFQIELVDLGATEINVGKDVLTVKTSDGAYHNFRTLPAGYRRILFMAMDIAYRSYILNGTVDSPGIVMIDEVDLHLHPALERDIVQRLTQTFPNIQFIVSTHSPLVLVNLSSQEGRNKVMRIRRGDESPRELTSVYGLDYNAGIEDIMGVSPRDEELGVLLDSYAYFRSNEMNEQAANILTLLRAKVGDENRLASLLDMHL